MAASTQPGIVYFTVPGDTHPDTYWAIRRGGHYWAANRWRGLRLCGVENKRAGAALVGGPGESIRVRLVAGLEVQP